MKKIYLTCVGRMKDKFFVEAVEEYRKRLSSYCELCVQEVADCVGEGAVERESDAILATIKQGEHVVLFDVGGKLVSSEDFAGMLAAAQQSGKTLRLIIGGSCGVDERVRQKASERVSFGRVTFPHRLMRVIAVEQLYRAFTILHGTPYHK